MPRLPIRFVLAASLSAVFALSACRGNDVAAVVRTDTPTPSGGTTTTPAPPATVTPQPGKWKSACAGTTAPDPAKADTGYVNAAWNASTRMVAATAPVIDGKTGADLVRADAINGGKKYNNGEFDKLRQPITADQPGKIAYALDYKTRHALPQ